MYTICNRTSQANTFATVKEILDKQVNNFYYIKIKFKFYIQYLLN